MSIKIIDKEPQFKPVTIEVTFNTPDELLAFYKLYGNMTVTALHLADTYGLPFDKMRDAIDDVVGYDEYKQLALAGHIDPYAF
jgi:hypothetical protein